MSQAIQRMFFVLIGVIILIIVGCAFLLMQNKSLKDQNISLQDQLNETEGKEKKALSDAQALGQQIKKLQNDNSDITQKLNDKDKEKQDLQSSYDTLKQKSDDLTSQADQANKDRDDWKSRLDTIRKERDDLLEKLKHQKEKIVYRDKPVAAPVKSEENADGSSDTTSDSTSEDISTHSQSYSVTNAQGDEYWAKILKQKAALEVELSKAKSELDKVALDVADLRKQNSDMQIQIKDLTNDKSEIERRLVNDKKALEDNFSRERQQYQRKLRDAEDLASNLSMEAARARGDQKSANDFDNKIKDQNAQLQSEVKQLVSTKVALEKTVSRLSQEKEDMSKRLADTEGVIQDRINEIWQIKQTLDQKITQMNDSKSDKEVELPPIVVNGAGTSSSSYSSMMMAQPQQQGQTHKIISINQKNNFVIVDCGESQGSSIGRAFKVYRDGAVIGSLEVIQVRRDISAADIKDQKADLQIGDQVR